MQTFQVRVQADAKKQGIARAIARDLSDRGLWGVPSNQLQP